MTAERQEKNRQGVRAPFRPGMALMVVLAWLAGVAGSESLVRAATTERIVVNRFSGLAINGFDPVAYFVEARAITGLPAFEAANGGVIWRFRNEGNRASFLAHPEIYGPQFGGYDPTDMARGVAVAGNPRFWLISGERLYLFGHEPSRAAFAADPDHFRHDAEERWPGVREGLAQ